MMPEPYITKTRCLPLDSEPSDTAPIAEAARVIRQGGLVAFPTETVYGLGADAFSKPAVDKIFRAKGRPSADPLIVHISNLNQMNQVATDIPADAYRLFDSFAPGPLTLVLKKQPRIPDNLTASLNTVALRIPAHPAALALIRAANRPIAAPSANRYSRPSPTCAQHVLDDLQDRVDIILDGGPVKLGLESTIVSLLDDKPQVLRPGAITLEQLRQILPDLVYRPRFLDDESTSAPAPGSMLKHYSPRAELILFRGENDDALRLAMRQCAANKQNVGLLAPDSDIPAFADLDANIASLGPDDSEAALRLFAALRSLDSQGLDCILARMPKPTGLGLAIADRLLRAAAGHVIDVDSR